MWGRWVLPASLPSPFSATLSPALLVSLCANVGPQGLLVVRLPALFVPHSASLGPTTATRVLCTPVPLSAPPTGLDVCFFFIYLVSNFHAVRFSVSSGCAKKCSVSTYAAILVLSPGVSVLSGLCLSLLDRSLADFHSQIYCGCLFPFQMLWVWEPGLGFRPHPSQVESSTAEILLHIFSYNLWEQGESFCTTTLPTSFSVACSVCPWL